MTCASVCELLVVPRNIAPLHKHIMWVVVVACWSFAQNVNLLLTQEQYVNSTFKLIAYGLLLGNGALSAPLILPILFYRNRKML